MHARRVAAALSAMTFAIGRRFLIVDGVERWKDADVDDARAAMKGMEPETLTVAFFAREEGRIKAPAALAQGRRGRRRQSSPEMHIKARALPKWLAAQARSSASSSTTQGAGRSSPRSATASSG